MYVGDFEEDSTVYFLWSTNDSDGASITRATDGTISVYKDNGATQTTAGITDTEDFDSLTGIHACTIDTSADAFYAAGADYDVVLSGATIDGQSVNAVLAHFSIENRFSVWDALMAGHQGAGTFGDQVANNLATASAVWNYGAAIGSALAAELADAILKRGVANVEDSADVDSLAALILARLHAALVGDVLKIYKTDDSTVFDEKAVTKSASALPVTSVLDP